MAINAKTNESLGGSESPMKASLSAIYIEKLDPQIHVGTDTMTHRARARVYVQFDDDSMGVNVDLNEQEFAVVWQIREQLIERAATRMRNIVNSPLELE